MEYNYSKFTDDVSENVDHPTNVIVIKEPYINGHSASLQNNNLINYSKRHKVCGIIFCIIASLIFLSTIVLAFMFHFICLLLLVPFGLYLTVGVLGILLSKRYRFDEAIAGVVIEIIMVTFLAGSFIIKVLYTVFITLHGREVGVIVSSLIFAMGLIIVFSIHIDGLIKDMKQRQIKY